MPAAVRPRPRCSQADVPTASPRTEPVPSANTLRKAVLLAVIGQFSRLRSRCRNRRRSPRAGPPRPSRTPPTPSAPSTSGDDGTTQPCAPSPPCVRRRQQRCRLCPAVVRLVERLRRHGYVMRRVETLLGSLDVQRLRLRCLACGEERYPLDEALGLTLRLASAVGVRERALWAAVELSYEKTEDSLHKFTGLAVSRGLIHRWAEEEGARLLAQDEAARTAAFAPGATPSVPTARRPVVYVQVDETGVHERGQRASMECKVGVIFSEHVEISKGRIALLDNRDWDAYWGQRRQELARIAA